MKRQSERRINQLENELESHKIDSGHDLENALKMQHRKMVQANDELKEECEKLQLKVIAVLGLYLITYVLHLHFIVK